MLKKYVAKFTVDILPSVAATVIGAYIVNHYIVTRPDAPVAAAVSNTTPDSAKPGARTLPTRPLPSPKPLPTRRMPGSRA